MTIRLAEQNSYESRQESGVGANSLALTGANFVTHTGGVVSLAAVGGEISGVNDTLDTFASDNVTVAKKEVRYTPLAANVKYEVTITGGTITSVDQGKYYDLATSSTVDGTTESETTGQLKLVEFVSATKSIFEIVNK